MAALVAFSLAHADDGPLTDGRCYFGAQGVEQDIPGALEVWKKAAPLRRRQPFRADAWWPVRLAPTALQGLPSGSRWSPPDQMLRNCIT
jgi:hypothetical protein